MLCYYNISVTVLHFIKKGDDRLQQYQLQDEDLISKKELLEKYNISYGALYRWKRKGLIPEEWFIRKSTQTGQETYFARKAILERVESIIKLKDSVSLEEMADIFYPKKEQSKKLVVEGKYGKHIFDFDELTSVSIKNLNGKKIELLSRLKETEL